MNKHEFLSLTDFEQQALVSKAGVLLISLEKDETSVSFYRLHHLFVKTISRHNGYRYVEVHTALDVLNLIPVIRDPANLLFAPNPY